LPKIKGRAMWRDVDGEIEVQLPWVAPGRAVELTDAVISRWADGQDNEDETAKEIFRWCLAEQDGHYHIDKVYLFWKKHGMTRSQVQTIREEYLLSADNDGPPDPVVTIDEVDYVLTPHIPGHRPAKLIPLARYNQMINEDTTPVKPIEPDEPEFDPFPLFKYSLSELNGEFPYKTIYDRFRGEIPRAKVQAIASEWEGRTFEIDGKTYCLQESEKGNKSRKIVLLDAARGPRPERQAPETGREDLGDIIIDAEFSGNDEPDDEPEAVPDWLQEVGGD